MIWICLSIIYESLDLIVHLNIFYEHYKILLLRIFSSNYIKIDNIFQEIAALLFFYKIKYLLLKEIYLICTHNIIVTFMKMMKEIKK